MSQVSYFTDKTVPYSGHKDGTGSRVQGYEDVIGDWLFEGSGSHLYTCREGSLG